MATGLWLAAGLIVASHFGANWIRAGYGGKVQQPDMAVATLPTELGGWRAVEEVPLDERTANVMGAGDSVSRVYRNAAGESASIHVAVWTDFKNGPTGLHYPEVCYPNAGWQILGTETVRPTAGESADADADSQPLRLMLLEHSGTRVVTGHWYEMGDDVFFSRNEAREIQRHYWGERHLPFVTKVLIQFSAPDVEGAKPRIEELAGAIADWTGRLRQNAPAVASADGGAGAG